MTDKIKIAAIKRITILIIDDHTLLRETWSFILDSDPRFSVIGESSSGEEGIEKARHLLPDVILMDINLPGIDGICATERILETTPETKVLVVSMHNDPIYARRILQHGAKGYITKGSTKNEMIMALYAVSQNEIYICDEIKNTLSMQLLIGEAKSIDSTILTKRELEITALVVKGCSSKEISETLCLSIKTVQVHRYNILKKLKLKNTAALVDYANNQLLIN